MNDMLANIIVGTAVTLGALFLILIGPALTLGLIAGVFWLVKIFFF